MMTPFRHPHRNRKRWQQIQTHVRFCMLVGPIVPPHPLAWQRRHVPKHCPTAHLRLGASQVVLVIR